MKKAGGITVFLSLCLLCVFALFCVMMESARLAGSRFYYQTAINGALDHLFSQYHRKLWRQYRILGLPCGSEGDLSDRLESQAAKYLETDNWYPIKQESITVTECDMLTDQGGDFLTREILEYMRYGSWKSLDIAPDEGERFLGDIREAAGAGMMADVYDAQTREVKKLESAVEKIMKNIGKQEEYAGDIADALGSDDAGGFRDSAKAFRREAGRMEGLMKAYDSQAKKLEEKLKESREKLSQVSGSFQGDHGQLFEQQMNPYEAYVGEEGSRRQELFRQQENSGRNLELLEQTEKKVEDLEDDYDARMNNSDPSDDYDLTLADAKTIWDGFIGSGLALQKGKGDPQKRKFLEQIRGMAQEGLLELVLPRDMEISQAAIPMAGLPSQSAEAGQSLDAPNPFERVLLHEYCGYYFPHILSRETRPVRYEMEYLLQGKGNDRQNLWDTAVQLLLIRQGVNLIQILADPAKREEARGLAAVIVGYTGLAPLVEITACFIMGVWATGEAVMDLRKLFSGGKIPLWKKKEDWQLSLEGLLAMGQNKSCPADSRKGSGLSYEHYLKLLMFLRDHQDLQMRILDMMEVNIRTEDPGFSMKNCAYHVDISGKACGKHVFFALGFVDNFISGAAEYPLEAPAGRTY